jgi:hypothetical protein
LLLLTLGGDVRVVTVVSLYFKLLQWGEEFSSGNFMLLPQLGVMDSRGG